MMPNIGRGFIMITDNERAYARILDAAIMRGDTDTARTLISHGADHEYRINFAIDADPECGTYHETAQFTCAEFMAECAIIDGQVVTHWQIADFSDPAKDFTGFRKPDAAHVANAIITLDADYDPAEFGED